MALNFLSKIKKKKVFLLISAIYSVSRWGTEVEYGGLTLPTLLNDCWKGKVMQSQKLRNRNSCSPRHRSTQDINSRSTVITCDHQSVQNHTESCWKQLKMFHVRKSDFIYIYIYIYLFWDSWKYFKISIKTLSLHLF